MLQVIFSRTFEKSFTKLPPRQMAKVQKVIEDFANEKVSEKMRLYELRGSLAGVWSLSVGGDLRIHFEYVGESSINLINVGTHA